jgi:hypothetical protein
MMTEADTLDTFLTDLKDLALYMMPPFDPEEALKLAERVGGAFPAFMRLFDAVLKLAEDGTMDRLAGMVEKMSDQKVLGLLEGVLDAAAEVDTESPPKVGLMGAVKELKDEDVQKTLGILLSIAKKMPRAMEKQ